MAAYSDNSPDEKAHIPIARPKFLQTVEKSNNTDASSSGSYVNDNDDNETPIFSKRKILLRMPNQYKGDFMHLTVSKNWLVCLLAAPPPANQVTLLRFFLLRALPPAEIGLDKYLAGYKIRNLFLDYTGHHMLISLIPKTQGLSADFLYIHGNGPKVRRIEKFKDHEITSVAFNREYGTESSTGPILLGTNRGLIFETELTLEAEKPSYKKQVYDLGLGRTKYPINGLEFLRVPNTNQYLIIVAAPDYIYTFQETLRTDEKSLQAIFSSYVNGTQSHGFEAAKTDLNYSVLKLYAQPGEKFASLWGWLCGSGIRHGRIAQSSITTEKFLLGDDIIPLDKDIEQRKHLSSEERRLNVPISFVLTEYHVLLMYPDHITGICLLNQQVIYEEYFHEQMGKLMNIVRDPFTGSVYVYTEKMLFNYKICDEHRHVWRIYLSKGLYDLAEAHAGDAKNINVVLESKAQAAIQAGNYISAAEILADTNKAFEEVCLKFIDIEDKRPIITYLRKRLDKLSPDHSEEQLMVLVTWLVDLYLTEINYPGRSKSEKEEWQMAYDEFMRQFSVVKFVRANRTTIHKLIAQHADNHNLAQFAIANEDYEEVVLQHLAAEKYLDALNILRKQKDPELYYKYCPIIMEFIPHETIEILKSQGRKFQVTKLIPTLITIDTPVHIAEVTKYLEYCIYNLCETNTSVHNYLVRLYAQHQPTKVIKYLETEGPDASLVHYDINYALCICLQFKVHEACVFLYCLLELWYDALDVALSFDMTLAKETASKPKDDETKSELWLRIVRHEIEGTNDVKKALDLLNECDLLRIEDLLPFFSDFEKIDDFKDPICKALKVYNEKIQKLQHEMEECTKQSDRVQNDLENIRERCLVIEGQEICNSCDTYLLVKPFFVFGCGHKFHADCLEKFVVPLLSSDKSRKLTMLKQQLESMLTQSVAMAESSKELQKKREKLKHEIENIVAADCPYCGLMIETIDQPFVEDWDQCNTFLLTFLICDAAIFQISRATVTPDETKMRELQQQQQQQQQHHHHQHQHHHHQETSVTPVLMEAVDNQNGNAQLATTTVSSSPIAIATASSADNMPEFCFYAEPQLCFNFHNDNTSDSSPSQQGAINTCHCRPHPNVTNSWYCCNITHISMITACRNTSSNWSNLHIYNMTMIEVDLSLSIFQTLHSLAITDGNISRLIKSFSRVSQIKCLNFSNNNLSNITMRAPPFLKFLNISKNNLTQIPKLKQNQNITLDVRDNKRMLCKPLLETIFRFKFVAPNSSYCLLDNNFHWFNSTDSIAINQLEMARRFHTECPVIPGKGNCICAPEHMIRTGDPSKPEVKIFCRVDCSNLGLTELPTKLPLNTFYFDITNNNANIGKHFHNNPTYQSIAKLFADNNRIESMHDLEGTKFMDHFQEIHLRNNAISRIWLLQRSRDIPDYNDILCRNMPQRVMELQEIKVCQSPHDWTAYVYYLIACEVMLLIALIAKVSYDYWVFKTAGYLPWPASKMPKLPCDWLCES
uniref:Vacuolar protein sorting-associated protein 18 homolog n=1 Tax=Glossina brevipalpis TaxID=37001 RepID=A0A1A9X021_9MUSC